MRRSALESGLARGPPDFLAVQGLRLHTSRAGARVPSQVRELRSRGCTTVKEIKINAYYYFFKESPCRDSHIWIRFWGRLLVSSVCRRLELLEREININSVDS